MYLNVFVSPFVSLPASNFYEITWRISIKFGTESLLYMTSGAFTVFFDR